MVTSAAEAVPVRRTCGCAAEAAVERAKLRAFITWVFAPPELPTYPPIDYAQEPAAARAARLRRIQDQVDSLFVPLTPADVGARYYRYW
jgi:hypothetical protein